MEPLDGRAEGVDDQLVVPVEGPSERPRVEDGSPGLEFGCDVDARLQLTAGARPRLGMRRADIDREQQVYHDVEVVLGGRRPDGRGVDGVPGEPRPHVQLDVVEARVTDGLEGRAVVPPVFDHEPLSNLHGPASRAADENGRIPGGGHRYNQQSARLPKPLRPGWPLVRVCNRSSSSPTGRT